MSLLYWMIEQHRAVHLSLRQRRAALHAAERPARIKYTLNEQHSLQTLDRELCSISIFR